MEGVGEDRIPSCWGRPVTSSLDTMAPQSRRDGRGRASGTLDLTPFFLHERTQDIYWDSHPWTTSQCSHGHAVGTGHGCLGCRQAFLVSPTSIDPFFIPRHMWNLGCAAALGLGELGPHLLVAWGVIVLVMVFIPCLLFLNVSFHLKLIFLSM